MASTAGNTTSVTRSLPQLDSQLPVGDQIFLDHVGHFVPDREAASRALVRAGFAPTPVSIGVNPDGSLTGTGNVTAMLSRGYIEVLFRTADTPLGAELDSAIAHHAGVHLAAFAVSNAEKAHRRLGEAGFPLRPLAEFERPVAAESGPATAAFTVARVERNAMPEGRIQILTHKTEDAVWQKRWLAHPNGALGLTSVFFAVDHTEEAAQRFARFTDRRARRSRWGKTIALDRGRVELVNAQAFAAALPESSIPSLPFAGAYGVVVRSLHAVESILRSANIHPRRAGEGLVASFPEELGKGVWLFSENSRFSVFA